MPASPSRRATSASPKAATPAISKPAKAARKASRLRRMVAHDRPAWKPSSTSISNRWSIVRHRPSPLLVVGRPRRRPPPTSRRRPSGPRGEDVGHGLSHLIACRRVRQRLQRPLHQGPEDDHLVAVLAQGRGVGHRQGRRLGRPAGSRRRPTRYCSAPVARSGIGATAPRARRARYHPAESSPPRPPRRWGNRSTGGCGTSIALPAPGAGRGTRISRTSSPGPSTVVARAPRRRRPRPGPPGWCGSWLPGRPTPSPGPRRSPPTQPPQLKHRRASAPRWTRRGWRGPRRRCSLLRRLLGASRPAALANEAGLGRRNAAAPAAPARQAPARRGVGRAPGRPAAGGDRRHDGGRPPVASPPANTPGRPVAPVSAAASSRGPSAGASRRTEVGALADGQDHLVGRHRGALARVQHRGEAPGGVEDRGAPGQFHAGELPPRTSTRRGPHEGRTAPAPAAPAPRPRRRRASPRAAPGRPP